MLIEQYVEVPLIRFLKFKDLVQFFGLEINYSELTGLIRRLTRKGKVEQVERETRNKTRWRNLELKMAESRIWGTRGKTTNAKVISSSKFYLCYTYI